MPGYLRQEVTPCNSCGFNEAPNFRKEERIAFREVGDRGQHHYSRETFLYQTVLVCVSCGHVQEVSGQAS